MKSSRGFTVIEIIVVISVFAFASAVFFIQRSNLEVANRDQERKTAINAMYYSLEEVYYKEHKSYPRVVNSTTLPSVDPALFKDPNGVAIGEGDSEYSYTGLNCSDDACKSYTLKTTLENEADYIRKSRNS